MMSAPTATTVEVRALASAGLETRVRVPLLGGRDLGRDGERWGGTMVALASTLRARLTHRGRRPSSINSSTTFHSLNRRPSGATLGGGGGGKGVGGGVGTRDVASRCCCKPRRRRPDVCGGGEPKVGNDAKEGGSVKASLIPRASARPPCRHRLSRRPLRRRRHRRRLCRRRLCRRRLRSRCIGRRGLCRRRPCRRRRRAVCCRRRAVCRRRRRAVCCCPAAERCAGGTTAEVRFGSQRPGWSPQRLGRARPRVIG